MVSKDAETALWIRQSLLFASLCCSSVVLCENVANYIRHFLTLQLFKTPSEESFINKSLIKYTYRNNWTQYQPNIEESKFQFILSCADVRENESLPTVTFKFSFLVTQCNLHCVKVYFHVRLGLSLFLTWIGAKSLFSPGKL